MKRTNFIKIYAKTAGEPIRIKVKSDSSVLYVKTEEIIEEEIEKEQVN